jgi:hypothetical protein
MYKAQSNNNSMQMRVLGNNRKSQLQLRQQTNKIVYPKSKVTPYIVLAKPITEILLLKFWVKARKHNLKLRLPKLMMIMMMSKMVILKTRIPKTIATVIELLRTCPQALENK